MSKFYIIFSVAIIFISFNGYSQGCSDAGFCTMGSLQPMQNSDSTYRHTFKLNFSNGIGEQDTKHPQIIPEFEFSFFKNNSIQLKVPFVRVTGDLGDNQGLGDISISTSQLFSSKDNQSFTGTLGFKIPTGTTDYSENGIPLAMPYQTGLGTFDLIIGFTYQYKKWRLGAGYQMVLDNNNKNRFPTDTSIHPFEANYFISNLLDRGDDALLRLERTFTVKKFNFMVGVLGIYRLQKDKIVDRSGAVVALVGSDGITLNATAGINYTITKRFGVNFIFGAPLVVRDVRADGLTRSSVGTLGLAYRF